jgi:phage head maturation protease
VNGTSHWLRTSHQEVAVLTPVRETRIDHQLMARVASTIFHHLDDSRRVSDSSNVKVRVVSDLEDFSVTSLPARLQARRVHQVIDHQLMVRVARVTLL